LHVQFNAVEPLIHILHSPEDFAKARALIANGEDVTQNKPQLRDKPFKGCDTNANPNTSRERERERETRRKREREIESERGKHTCCDECCRFFNEKKNNPLQYL
jgi:hypothetical protein